MPIYAYRCESCGFGKDILRKLSDAPLTQCPECGKDTFAKQVTAAGFQLKGSGWYVTDFRGGNNGGKSTTTATENSGADAAKSESVAADSGSKPAAASASTDSSSSGTAAASAGASASSGAA
ncbi:FmdB family regulatory protein [Caballeronia arationis]|jgi:putative FmdB family regulatory protein|uniref:Putative regulatory protein, FmdB family n=1 Tax=Caballeronia arationis TaxID=1777142 RepID=A0A7Z7N603_9BURK|nr:FmdB family zinc ribbon protein [Caballeronia arationis]SAK98505.1 FmdB family regulatory protein [Caballeronia arationis]SOE82722.1 putative regulatory protein, FmdB family [Caballeronia arationis]